MESTPFRRSQRLRDFLVYVGNETVLHGVQDLHEQQIGMAVFGRSASYDTSQDNIVRVNAMELRKRIEIYFANEGSGEPLTFEIPRGSYSPVFRVRPQEPIVILANEPPFVEEHLEPVAATGSEVTPSLPPGSSHLPQVFPKSLQIALIVMIAGLTAALIFEVHRDQQAQSTLHKWQSGPALRAFWGNFFGRKLPPEIVLADTSFGLAQDVLQKQLSLANYLDYSYRTAQSPQPLSSDASQQQRKDLAVIFSRSTGSIGDFRVARRITELQTGDDGTRLVAAREYAGHRLRWSNTIFVGSSRSNPWVELFEDRLAYHFKQSYGSGPSVITLDNPTGSEQPQYEFSADSGAKTAYCMIVFLPNPTNTGNTLIIAGTDSQATEAGGDFLTSEDSLERLQALLRQKPFPYFQALLRVSRVTGTQLESEIVSSRIVRN
ncbi:hypothetical protein [Granulicella sibirica]|uniref:Adenylate cyclase n=1 Tax=Granulicella sibirica TaxID=2479048 RepID=A0A4Q0SUI0_9BACT|nr:hypothetical protein [Granulicella sibirica]RXH54703.1 Adenylate cyclase [Granulicella sibirica]